MAANPYGHHWRTVIRPRILARAGGVFDSRGCYIGGASCERCRLPDVLPVGIWQRSQLDIAHLDGDITHQDDEDLAALCRRCHRALDFPEWAAKFGEWVRQQRKERIARKDSARPILKLLEEGEISQ